MGCRIKVRIARSLCCNTELNRKILKIKKSWDEVEKLLACVNCGKRDCCKK